MGFFGKIFGEKKPANVSIEFDKAGSFLEKELSGRRKLLFEESAKKLAEIKHLIRQTKTSLKELEAAQAAGRSARIDKIVKTAKSNALRQISSLLGKMEPPNTSDLDAIQSYAKESISLLQQSGSFGKNVAYAGISFKNEMKQLGENLKQLSNAFSSLKKLLEENKAVFLQDRVGEELQEIRELRQNILSFEKSSEEIKKSLEQASLEKSRLKTSLKNLRESPEFKSIDSLNGEKASLLREKQKAKTELLDLFAKVEKPLHRLDKAVKARKYFLPGLQAELLHEFLTNPFRALKKDPKALSLKEILKETNKAIESGTIDLKEKEKEKKLALLQELLSFDFFSESFWKFNKLDSQLIAVEKKLSELPALKTESESLASLKKFEAEEISLKVELDSKKSQVEAAKKSIQALLASSQKLLSQATGKQVFFKD